MTHPSITVFPDAGEIIERDGLILLASWPGGECCLTASFRAKDLVAVHCDWEAGPNKADVVVTATTPHRLYHLNFTDLIVENDDGGMCAVDAQESLERIMLEALR